MSSVTNQHQQRGAATLLTAVVLLICITLVALLAAKTVLVETQITADNNRMAQAVGAANAGLDYALGYFNGSATVLVPGVSSVTTITTPVAGFDHDGNGCPDLLATAYGTCNETAGFIVNSSYNGLSTTATITFDNSAGTRCVAVGATPDMKSGLITSVGRSDDNQAVRTISQCVGSLDVFGGNAPKQPMISMAGVGLSGNFTVINRFNNTTIWTGAAMDPAGSAQTYLKKGNPTTRTDLESTDTSNSFTSPPITELANGASSKGLGVDVIASDPRLGTLTGDEFFNNFFYGDRSAVYNLANSNEKVFTTFPSPTDASGIVWVGNPPGGALGNFDQSSNQVFGSPESPVVMVINGDFNPGGRLTVYGMLYITGQLNAQGGGTFTTYGSIIVEDPAGASGNGNVHLIYTPFTLDKSANPISGTTTAISGSWRDW